MEEAAERVEGIIDSDRVLEERVSVSEVNSSHESKLLSHLSLEDLSSNYATKQQEPYVEGALAVIYHINKDTGEMEFYFEQKSPNYPHGQEDKNALVGGSIDTTDKSPYAALVREFKEEIQGKGASLLEGIAKNNTSPCLTVDYYTNGLHVRDYVFKLEIEGDKEWETIKNSKMTNDAGYPTIFTREDIEKSDGGQWAFNHYDIITKFLDKYHPK